MHSKRSNFSLLLVVFLLAGCNSARSEVPITYESHQAEAVLSADLLYAILAGEIAGQRGQLNVATDYYVTASQLAKEPQVLARAIQVALYAEEYSQAITIARLWLKQTPNNAEVHKILASLSLRMGDVKTATKHYHKMLSYAHGNLEQRFFIVVASVLGKGKKPDDAWKVMKMLEVYYPEYAELFYAQSTLAILLERYPLAEQAIQQALTLRPLWSEAILVYSKVLQHLNKIPDAVAVIENSLQQLPSNLKLRIGYGKLLMQQKKFKAAANQFSMIVKMSPNDEASRYTLAVLLIETNDFTAAKKHLYQLVKQKKLVDEAAYYLAQIAETEKDYQRAISWYQQVKQGETVLDAQIRIALLSSRQGQLEQSLEKISKLRQTYPKASVRLYRVAGELLREGGKYERAFNLYNQALLQFPDNLDLLYERALVAEKRDRIDILERDLRKILQTEPENTHALNALGYTLADRTTRYNEALHYIEKAFGLQPDDPAVIDSMGWIQYRLGNNQSALKFLRQAFAKNTDEEIAAHLGEVLWVSGAKDEALKVLQSALEKSPKSIKLQQIIRQYQQ